VNSTTHYLLFKKVCRRSQSQQYLVVQIFELHSWMTTPALSQHFTHAAEYTHSWVKLTSLKMPVCLLLAIADISITRARFWAECGHKPLQLFKASTLTLRFIGIPPHHPFSASPQSYQRNSFGAPEQSRIGSRGVRLPKTLSPCHSWLDGSRVYECPLLAL